MQNKSHLDKPVGGSAVDIADAIAKKHTAGTDTALGFPGTTTGDIIRYNSVSGAWEVKSEPFALKQINLTPAAAAILDIEGGMYYKSTAKAVYVCTDV